MASLHLTPFLVQHPFATAALVLVFICLSTRLITELNYRSTLSKIRSSSGATVPVPILPYWIPWLGHGISFAIGGPLWIESFARNLDPASSTFALWMAGSKHNILTSPSSAKQTLLDRNAPLTMEPFVFHIMKHFWDDRGGLKKMDQTALWGDVHKALTIMVRESFVTVAIRGAVEGVQTKTWNLVSGAHSYIDQSVWERSGKVEVISAGDSTGTNPFIAEASLHPLLREFVGDIATRVFMGNQFAENNPNILPDLWKTDGHFNLFIAAIPTWLPGMRGATAARERIVDAVQEHHEALGRYLDGQDPGPNYSDMSDVSSVIVNRYIEFRKGGADPRTFATGDAAIFWAMNVNANQVIFWLVWYIYSTPGLLSDIRREVSRYVKFVPPPSNGLPITEAPRLSIDIDSLWQKCPLLKSAFFETMRIEAAAVSYKQIEADFVVSESEEDARILGKAHADSYVLGKDEYLCIPHNVHQNDGRYWPNPERFDPRRFWTKTDQDGKPVAVDMDDDSYSAIRVDYGTMKVWGGGKQSCKGKTFAEREVVLFAAAIVSQWDITPVDNGGKWVHPGRIVSAGTGSPKQEVKVRMSRREAW
ncbi:hypothetical protein PV10_04115 [Exophiala mesophila]|uniref:Cytochrome P450 n=1 Tax=Exophiala mesophila TaxID=212818 RepID=A0A0D1XX92_EXOME|nr:uncharacterized protein PV10_04115 [Exophiala mesophila]KIV92851.1 hypothetical protein PV10_04115 [Exophiala mesophila]